MMIQIPLPTAVLLMSLLTTVAASGSPVLIAHRGASGYLPEHTLEAYAFAHAQGADYVEPDLVLTRDGHFICLHDIHLEATTDVARVYPDRARSDGRFYAIDFDLAEIRQLQARERLEGRFPRESGARFTIPTFEEMVALVQGLNATTGRTVGIYPELKAPGWHGDEGQPMEEKFLRQVHRLGYRGADAPIFVQSFEKESLRELRRLGSELPQVYLFGKSLRTRRDRTAEGLHEIAQFADGIGPAKELIAKDPELVVRAHAAGLVVHPWTFRADDVGRGYDDVEEELRDYLFDFGVDGVFTDFPDAALRVLSAGATTN